MRGRLFSGAVVLATVLAAAPLLSQSEVTTAPIGSGMLAVKLTCPTNMLMIGISVGTRTLHPVFNSVDRIDCSLYKADGTRFGSPTTLVNAALTLSLTSTHLVCPGDQAIAIVRTHTTSDLMIDYAEMYCATIGPNGGQSTPVKAGTIPAGLAMSTSGSLTCPGTTFAHGATSMSGGLALTCIAAPVMANAVASVGLTAFHTVAGTAVSGTVTLNGYAVGNVSVGLGVSDAPGAAVPTSITVPDGAHSASFSVQSAPSTAGCSTIRATFGASTTAPLVITPAPPAGATFTFSILPASASLVWSAPSSLTAIVAYPSPLKSGIVLSQPTVTFASNQPDVLAIPSSPQRVGSDTVKVTMSALKSGCAVVTVTVNGVPFRKTLRLMNGF